MKNRSGEKIKLASIDELLGVVNEESAMEIEISKIHPFKNHPFKVLDDEKMQDLVESVKINSLKVFPEIACPMVKPPVGIEVCPVRHAYLLNGRFINAALTQQLFLRFFPDTPFPVLPSVVVCHSYFLQSELIERAEKSPLIFPKEKTRGLNALNFNFLLSFLVLLGFWLCVCLQRSGLCPTSPRLHARKVRQKRLPVSAPVHYPTAKAGRLSACPP